MFRRDELDSLFNKSNTDQVNCTIWQNKLTLNQHDIVEISKKILSQIEVEQNLTDDWIFNQLVHYFRTDGPKDLECIIMNLALRYTKEFIENNRSILAKWLVRDESISIPMLLWIIDIEFADNQTWIIKLSDYYYSINILLKGTELEEDAFLIDLLSKGEFYLGMKLKIQNIQYSMLASNNIKEFRNPVVNAQNKEIFKASINSISFADDSEKVGKLETPLFKSISQLNQWGGRTWNVTGIVIYKYPIFFWGHKSVYMQSTFEYLSEDIVEKINEEINHEIESRSSKFNGKIDIDDKRQLVEKKYGFDTSTIHFGIVIQNEIEAINKNPKYMLIIVSNMSVESYENFKIGQTVICSNLYPDSFKYKRYSFPLVFKTIKNSIILIEDKFIKGLKASDINQSYKDFRNYTSSLYLDYDGKDPLSIEFQNYGFIYIVGIVLKVFINDEWLNSANKPDVKSFIVMTSSLTLINVNVHKSSFLLQKGISEGDIYLIQNLNYEISTELNDSGVSRLAMSKYSSKKVKKGKDLSENIKDDLLNEEKENNSSFDADFFKVYDQFTTTDFTIIEKKSTQDEIK